MGLSQAIGNTFRMPQYQGKAQVQQGGQQQQQGGSILGDPMDKLQNVTNVTQEYYAKWGELESFASEMKLQYGIDVTKPDFSSNEGREAHEIYTQALADLRYQGNKLQGAQASLSKFETASVGAQGDRLHSNQDPTQEVFDMNKVTMDEKAQTQSTREDLATWKWKQDYTNSLRDKRADKKKRETAEDLEVYNSAATDISQLASGEVDWTVGEDGTISSDFWNNKYLGSKTDKGKIHGIVLGEDGVTYIETGKPTKTWNEELQDYDQSYDRTPINEETAENILKQYAQGQSLDEEEAAAYIKSLKDAGGSLMSLFTPPEGSAKKEDAIQKSEGIKTAGAEAVMVDNIAEITKLADSSNSTPAQAKIIEEAIKGKVYKGRVIKSVVQRSLLGGKFLITFEDGETISLGGSGGNVSSSEIDGIIRGGNIDNDPQGLGI